MKKSLNIYTFAVAIFLLLVSLGALSDTPALTVFNEQYPKAIYFRNAENSAANPNISYQKWAKRWSKLDGMVVKALDEEIPGRSKEAQRKFIQYKKDNPSKLMLLHFNGNARDPNFDFDAFKAEDWTYFVGTHSTSPITASDTRFSVVDSNVFRDADDLALVPLKDSGDLDWRNAEQVKLVSIDKNNIINVKRGLFGSKSTSHKMGKAYLVAHVSQPAIAPGSQQALWRYNFTNIANDGGMPIRLTNNLLQYLGKGKSLSVFDGVEFDVLADIRGLKHHSRQTPIDYNFDGKASDEDRVFQQQYSHGVERFLASLRNNLGDGKLILADGNEPNQQRAFGILNGIESETWPSHWDPEIETWSSGMNRHLYWNEHSYSPSFSYIKIGELPQKNGGSKAPSENARRLRVAAALFMDATIAPAYRPLGKKLDNWSEFTDGKKHYRSWLGKAVSDVKYFPVGSATSIKAIIVNPLDTVVKQTESTILKQHHGQSFGHIRFTLPEASDVVVTMNVKSNPKSDFKPNRVSYMALTPSKKRAQKNMTWTGDEDFKARFYFKKLAAGSNTIHITSDAETLTMSNLDIKSNAELVYREFEYGLVIANPFSQRVSVAISDISSRRIHTINDKLFKLKGTVDINPKEALFVRFKP
ncbi:hypothetical protein [Shewanella sp. MEBiC00475]|uniref:hypothetical protein n=1 Tax=Shewanella sp. MEBiC00475 TaxID=2575361 RepID=UPI0010BFC05E|nr:hypothetical protein [Shewanella sp. MEBiC00475]